MEKRIIMLSSEKCKFDFTFKKKDNIATDIGDLGYCVLSHHNHYKINLCFINQMVISNSAGQFNELCPISYRNFNDIITTGNLKSKFIKPVEHEFNFYQQRSECLRQCLFGYVFDDTEKYMCCYDENNYNIMVIPYNDSFVSYMGDTMIITKFDVRNQRKVKYIVKQENVIMDSTTVDDLLVNIDYDEIHNLEIEAT